MSDKRISHLLDALRDAKTRGDSLSFAESLKSLAVERPNEWRRILLLAGLIPDPSRRSLDEELSFFLKSLAGITDAATESSLREAGLMILGLLDIGTRMRKIRGRLEQCSFFERSKATQLFRMAAFIETQARNSVKEGMKHSIRGRTYDSAQAVETFLKDPRNPGGASPIGVYEAMCGAAEVVLEHLLWLGKDSSYGRLDATDSPYNTGNKRVHDVLEVVLLAEQWADLKYLWDSVRYNGWLPRHDEQCVKYSPPDWSDLVQGFIAHVRGEHFKAGQLPLELSQAEFTDDAKTIGKLSRKIALPKAGERWDGRIEAWALSRSTRSTMFTLMSEWYVENRHYKPLSANLRIGRGAEVIGWDNWLKARNALYVIAEAFSRAVDIRLVPDTDDYVLRCIAIVDLTDLAATVSKASGVDIETCCRALEILTFDPEHRGLDIWDMPLLPLEGTLRLFVPSLCLFGNPITALENLVAEYAPDRFGKRGHSFERAVSSSLGKLGIRAESRVAIPGPSGEEMEYDVIAWWEDHLLLIETKCLKSVYSPLDEFRAREEIDKSILQLKRRRNSLPIMWDTMRNRLPGLALSQECPSFEKVICISLTNIMRFTGMQEEGIYVSDDSCFLRFWGSKTIDKIMQAGNRAYRMPIANIRNREEPTPEELKTYLSAPPQMMSIGKGLQVNWRYMVPLDLGDKLCAVPEYSFGATGTSPLS